MSEPIRGRPKLNIPLKAILEAVRRRQNVVHAAKELGCSPAYIHGQFKTAGITLTQVLKMDDISR